MVTFYNFGNTIGAGEDHKLPQQLHTYICGRLQSICIFILYNEVLFLIFASFFQFLSRDTLPITI